MAKRELQTLGDRKHFLNFLSIQGQENQNGLNTRFHKHHSTVKLKKPQDCSKEMLSSILIFSAALNKFTLRAAEA